MFSVSQTLSHLPLCGWTLNPILNISIWLSQYCRAAQTKILQVFLMPLAHTASSCLLANRSKGIQFEYLPGLDTMAYLSCYCHERQCLLISAFILRLSQIVCVEKSCFVLKLLSSVVWICVCMLSSRKTLLPLPPSLLLPLSAVKISLPMPECHMWSTLMRCIFNPTDLHFQNFPLPVLPRNGAQIERESVVWVVPCVWAFVLIFLSVFIQVSLSFSIWKIEAVALDRWYLRFTNSHFLDEIVKKKKKTGGADKAKAE